ncbi:uncharacterized protein EV420DRAFT_1766979 [Desarmillaria tabescens]|uniref:Uncharacterized protein n=1 Tax=Armillaria tabescens TaxID=1929756 RepID=A0AA39JXD8_ARMTA|nr:uncharacterized protein EV420DRAFT_1766979 [Desarmillaria tabescens]KAK0449576.1 hypothetical protein EV420DRAFT_1766979 [Desarmillaria tabescens]
MCRRTGGRKLDFDCHGGQVIQNPQELANLRFDAAASLALLERIREEKFASPTSFLRQMEQQDKFTADAAQERANDSRLEALRLLAYLARCFCQDSKGSCVAAVLGKPRTSVESDEEPATDDRPDDDGEGGDDDDDDILFSNPMDLPLPYFSSTSDTQAEHDVEFIHTTPPPSPPKATAPSNPRLVLLLADNWAPRIPSHFNETSILVKNTLSECIRLQDVTLRQYRLILLGRKTSSVWIDEAFTKLIDAVAYISSNSNTVSHPNTDSEMLASLDEHFAHWSSNGGVEVDGQASVYEEAFLQLCSHFPEARLESVSRNDPPFRENPISASLVFFRAVVTCILGCQVSSPTDRTVILAQDSDVSNKSFVVLLAMEIFADSRYMNDLRQVPTPSSISDSQDVGVRLRRFRRRWLRIVSPARGAQSVAVAGLPLITRLLESDGSDDTQEDFDRYFQVLWAQPGLRPPIDPINPVSLRPPFALFSDLCESRTSLVDNTFGWTEALIAGTWKPKLWDIRLHAEVQLVICCEEMGIKIAENTIGVTKRPCLACDHTLARHIPTFCIPSSSKKPFRTWALPDRFPIASDIGDIVADIKKSLLDEIEEGPPAQTNVPGSMTRRENISDSSYGSLGGEVSNTVSNKVDWTKLKYIGD